MREIKGELDLLRLRDYNVYIVHDTWLTVNTHEWIPYKVYYVPYMNHYIEHTVGKDERKYMCRHVEADTFLAIMKECIRREHAHIYEYSMEEFDKILDKTDMMKELTK